MKPEVSNECGKRTKYMYQFNHGLFCEQHWRVQQIIQDNALARERFTEQCKEFSRPWNSILTWEE